MAKQKVDIFIDDTGTALVNMVAGFEEIVSCINKSVELPDFLSTENIELLKKNIDVYKNKNSLLLKRDMILFQKGVELQKKKELTMGDLNVLAMVAVIQKKSERRKNLVNYLNKTKDNIFMTLIKNNPQNERKIEKINQEWIARSYFAEIPSDNLLVIGKTLERLEYFFSELIIKDNTLPDFFKKYKVQIDVMGQAENALKFLQFEKKSLSEAMLLRLELARLSLPDDVLLATFESLKSVWSVDCFKEFDKYFFKESLSSQLLIQFYSYIQRVEDKIHIKKLHALYAFDYVSIPDIVSFTKNNYAIFPNYDYFTLNKMDFTEDYLVHASFVSGCIKDSCMNNAYFALSNFSKCSFINVNATKANFNGSSFNEANLQWIFAKGANFLATDLSNTRFHGANLYNTNFERAKLNNTDFSMSNLQQANFCGAYGGCNFDGADLSSANLIGLNLSKISCVDTIFIGSDFIDGQCEKDIASSLDLLECQIKNHTSRTVLWKVIEQDLVRKMDNMQLEVRKSTLLQHSLFSTSRDKTSPFYEEKVSLFQHFKNQI